MKRKILIVYVFIAFILLCTNVYAAITMDLSLVPEKTSVKQGSDLVVTVRLNNISSPISSIEGYINVDENVLEPISESMVVSNNKKIELKSNGEVKSTLSYEFNPKNLNADYDVIFNTNKETIENNDCFFVMDLREDIKGDYDILTLKFKVKENATVSQATQAVKLKIASAMSASTMDKVENISANLNFEVISKDADVPDDQKPDDQKPDDQKPDDQKPDDSKDDDKNNNENTDTNTNTNTNENRNDDTNTNKNNNKNNNNTNTNNNKNNNNTNTNNNNTNKNTNTNNNKNVNANKNLNDTTVSGNKIPAAGAKMLILPVAVFAVLGYVSYVKYLKYKEF